MSPLPISRTQMDKLGERLAEAETPSDDDLDLLLEVLDAYQAALEEVQVRLRDIGYQPTSRTKTTTVLVEKLRREHSSLKSVQDIAGARIVVDCDRDEQDEIVRNVVEAFSGGSRPPKVKDRRVEPSSGYRAVHVIVTVQDLPVEVQVRTSRQDQWAQIVESLGDKWGRGIRYGEEPPEPDIRVHPNLGMTRRRVWDLVTELAGRIETLEEVQVMLNEVMDDDDFQDPGVLSEQEDAAREAFRQEVSDLKVRLAEAEKQMWSDLAQLAAITEIAE